MLNARCRARRFAATLALAATVVAPACADSPTAPSAVRTVATAIVAPDVPDARRALTAAERRWAARGPRSYDFSVTFVCFCFESGPKTARFEVRNGVTTAPGATAETVERFSAHARVELLFAEIRRLLDRAPYDFRAEYDATTGYPVSYYADLRRNTADDEGGVSISDFVAR